MKTYEFRLQHDAGEITIRLSAEDLATARRQALASEKAPASAILWWRVVPTHKQIQKTKSLLRHL